MKVGDLVKHRPITRGGAEHLKDWLGIVVNFDKDGDPCVHWYDKGVELYDEPTWEFKTAVEKI
tara:strand:- start:52 stop:240 length:189 start_codon:yes stop_codon:yes gene_type:complete